MSYFWREGLKDDLHQAANRLQDVAPQVAETLHEASCTLAEADKKVVLLVENRDRLEADKAELLAALQAINEAADCPTVTRDDNFVVAVPVELIAAAIDIIERMTTEGKG